MNLPPPFTPLAKEPYHLPYPWGDRLRNGTIALLTASAFFFLFRFAMRRLRRRVRFRRSLCIVCAYDLRATAKRCPECGAEPPPFIRTRVLRHWVCSLVFVSLVLTGAGVAGLWVRSHWVSDCWALTTQTRSDALYTTRGVAVLRQSVLRHYPKWTHDTENPADMPRGPGDVGGSAEWRFLGMEYAADVRLFAIPFWQLTVGMVLLTAISVSVSRRLRPIRLFPGCGR